MAGERRKCDSQIYAHDGPEERLTIMAIGEEVVDNNLKYIEYTIDDGN